MLHRHLVLATFGILIGIVPAHAQGDLSTLSDPFEDYQRLQQWKRLDRVEDGFPSMLTDIGLYAETGCLHMEPTTSLWVSDFRGPFLFKEIDGDFVLTTRVFLKGKRFATPATRWSLGGLMARAARDVTAETWTAGHENWVSLMAGSQSVVRKYAVEARSTLDSETSRSSIPLGKEWTWTILRMVRVGPTFLLLAQPEGSPWMVVARHTRADLPSRLQVGLTACDDWLSAMPLHRDPQAFNAGKAQGNPDVVVMFDYADFARPNLPDGTGDLADESITDARVLELFAD